MVRYDLSSYTYIYIYIYVCVCVCEMMGTEIVGHRVIVISIQGKKNKIKIRKYNTGWKG